MRSHIDTLTIILSDDGEMEWLDDVHDVFAEVGRLDFEERKHGKNHYDKGGAFMHNGALFCEVNWSGEHQNNTVQLMLKGLGCKLVKDWRPVVPRLLEFPRCRISRLDVALDVFDGSLTIEDVWNNRENTSLWRNSKQGRMPLFTPVGHPEIAGPHGRTLYIGSRDTDLYARLYEKGLQVHKGLPRDALIQREDAAYRVGDWVRFEVELKAKKKSISIESLLNPDAVMAGCYPWAAALVQCSQPIFRVGPEHQAMDDLALILKHAHKQYGPSFRTALDTLGPQRLLELIVGSHPNANLIRKGIKLCDPKDYPVAVEPETDEIS